MIRYIEREKLDVKKYNSCIESSLNHKVYAYSWYLDNVTDNWGILVYGNYQYVMPLPWRKKYGIYYVYPPEWTQQLGVFSAKEINENLISEFVKKIPRKFKKRTINFNSGNFNKKFSVKLNFYLPLSNSYLDISQRFSKLRKRYLKKFKEDEIVLKESDSCDDLIALFTSIKKDAVAIIPESYNKLKNLVSYLIKNEKIQILKAFNKNDEVLGGAIFIIENGRIYYLFSTVNKAGRENHVMTKIIDSIIKQYSETNNVLDFEGSMVPGIARFFKSFGAVEEQYFTIKNYVLF